MSKSIGCYCPHCKGRMRISARRQPSPYLHTMIAQCVNPDCMASFNVHIEIAAQIQPCRNQLNKLQLSLLGETTC